MSITDARTGVVYETVDELMIEIDRLADLVAPKCEHGLRVRCIRCLELSGAVPPRRRRNTWSDESDSPSAPPPQATPVDGAPQEEIDHAGEEGPRPAASTADDARDPALAEPPGFVGAAQARP